MPLVVATSNQGKLHELRQLLPREITLMTAGELGIHLPVETGATFAENALLKARAAAMAGYPALADDSGLEIDALHGEPGIRSARYAGCDATDERNNALVLQRLAGVPHERRTARFQSVVALISIDGTAYLGHGTLEGRIATVPRGSGGFGYDPLFAVEDQFAGGFNGQTLAELGSDVKNTLSHRVRAVHDLFRALVADGIELAEMTEGAAHGRFDD